MSDEASEKGLKHSLFERMLRSGVPAHLLDTQYRMHSSLCDFPSKCFYRGRLKSGTDDGARPPVRGVPWPSSAVHVALLPSSAPEEGGAGASKRNSGEASAVIELVRGVLHAGDVTASQIGIVTPYSAQVTEIDRRD